MSYQLQDDSLRSAYERQLSSDRDPEQDECLLQALIECVSNSDLPAEEKLKRVESGLMGLMKLKDQKRRHDVEVGRLMSAETATAVAFAYCNVFMQLVQENVPDSVLHFVTDMVQLRMYDECKENEKLRCLLYKDWTAAQQAFEGENREQFIAKLQHDRERTERSERLLEAK